MFIDHLLRAYRRRRSLLTPLTAHAIAVGLYLAGHDRPAAVIAVTGIAWLAFALTLADNHAARLRDELHTAQARITNLQAELADATTDPVTGLPVRRLAEAHLTDTDPATTLSVAVIDVDDMHGINNSHGHQFGDAYLAGIADQLHALALPGDLVARLGGDEFVYITDRAPQALARTLATATHGPITIGDKAVPMQLSIGIYHVPGGDPHTALGCADLAMYTAKRRRSGIEHYDADRDGTPLPPGVRPPVRRRDRHTNAAASPT
jgi:diguanylate cyclase (GGDEF)-like protein